MAAEALEQSVLESKDKDQLLAIAKALGLKASARTKKSDIIDSILETTGSAPAVSAGAPAPLPEPMAVAAVNGEPRQRRRACRPTATAPRLPTAVAVLDGEPPAEWELDIAADLVSDPVASAAVGAVATNGAASSSADRARRDTERRGFADERGDRRGRSVGAQRRRHADAPAER